MDPVQTVLATLIVGLLTILALLLANGKLLANKSHSKYSRSTLLVLGATNAGKTSLFYKLTQGVFAPTVSSIEPNVGEIALPLSDKRIAKKYQIIDYPGHATYTQLVHNLIENDITLPNLKAVVYVVDSSAVNINNSAAMEQVASFLFHLYPITEKMPNGVDFLFAVNKNELFDSMPPARVRSIIETEINKLVQSVVADKRQDESVLEVRDYWLGVIGRPGVAFRFDMLEGNMDFFGGSVSRGDVESWGNWLDERVVN